MIKSQNSIPQYFDFFKQKCQLFHHFASKMLKILRGPISDFMLMKKPLRLRKGFFKLLISNILKFLILKHYPINLYSKIAATGISKPDKTMDFKVSATVNVRT